MEKTLAMRKVHDAKIAGKAAMIMVYYKDEKNVSNKLLEKIFNEGIPGVNVLLVDIIMDIDNKVADAFIEHASSIGKNILSSGRTTMFNLDSNVKNAVNQLELLLIGENIVLTVVNTKIVRILTEHYGYKLDKNKELGSLIFIKEDQGVKVYES